MPCQIELTFYFGKIIQIKRMQGVKKSELLNDTVSETVIE